MMSSLTACFPIHQTIRPELDVSVMDENGNPVNQAKVTLITQQRPAFVPLRYDVQYTKNGKTHFQPKHEWQRAMLMMHGIQFYYWALCVEKETYSPQYLDKIKEKDQLQVELRPLQSNQSQQRSIQCDTK